MSQILKYSVYLLLLMILVSCEENSETNNESQNVIHFKNDLELSKFSNVNISENVAVNWESIKVTEKGNFEISEISAYEKAVSTLESNFLENHLKYQIVTIESEGQLHSYFVEVYTNKGSNVYPKTITKLNGFTGTLNVFLLNGENLGSVAIYNGRARNISENNNLNILAESINAFLTKSDTTNKMPQCGGNYTVTIDQTISRFDVWTSAGEIVAVNYVGTTTTRTTSIMAYPCDGLYDKSDILNQRLESYNYKNGSGGGSGTIATVITDPSFSNNPCLLGVFNKLGGSLVFQNYLKKFDGDFSVANLKLSVGVDATKPDASAVTYQPANSLIEIKFNPDKLNTPPLNIAKNFAHEILHAEMFEKLLKLSGKKEIPWSLEFIESIRNDEPKIVEYYTRYWYDIPIGGSISDPQHEYMAQLSINTIKDIIKGYDNTQSEDVYTAIAWWGLMGVGVPNGITGLPPQPTVAWVNVPQAERVRLIDIYNNFIKTNASCQ